VTLLRNRKKLKPKFCLEGQLITNLVTRNFLELVMLPST